jgi:hypothetical protein
LSYDLITGLPIIGINGIKYITQLFNAILLKWYFPAHRKITQIILIFKSRKPPNKLTSYQPVSLLPTVSKVFKNFGYRQRHSTIDQIH